MATYKGIGWDSTNVTTKVNQSGDVLDVDGSITASEGVTIDAGGLTVTAGGASINGDLVVSGDIVSRGEVNLVVEDPFIDLGVGNFTTTAESGGLTLSMNRNSGFTTETITAATEGDPVAPSAPTLTSSTNPSQFAAGDILVLANSDNNNGIFVVNGVSGATITLKGVGGTAISGSVPFAQSQVTTETGQSADAYKVDLKVLAVADGTASFNDAGGSAYAKGTFLEIYVANATESDFTSNGDYLEVGGSSVSLQDAYDVGNTITTSGSNDVTITTTAGNFVVQGGGLADFGSSTPLSAFNLDTSGAIAIDSSAGTISLDAGAASNFTTSAGVLTFSGAGGITNTSTGGTYTVNATGQTVDIDGSTIQINGNGQGHFIVNDELDLQSSSGNVDIDAGGNVEIDAAAAVLIQGATTSVFQVQGNDGSDIGLNLLIGNLGAGEGNIGITSTVGGNITLQNGAGQNELVITTDTATFAADVVPSVNDTFDLGTNVNAWKDLYLSESITFKGATGENEIVLPSNLADALSVTDGVGDVFKIVSTTGSEQFEFSYGVQFDNNSGFLFATESTFADSLKDEDDMASNDENALATQQSIKAYVDNRGENANYNSISELTVAPSTTVTARQVITVNAGGSAALARADVAATSRVVGFALNGGTNGQTILVAQHGTLGGFTGLSAGSAYYLDDTTAGNITATAPNGSGDTVFQVGYAISASTIVIQLRHVMTYG